MKILNWITWFMFSVSLVISVLSIVVAYGIKYIPQFANLLPLEISLGVTFFFWGIYSMFECDKRAGRRSLLYSILIIGILISFGFWGIY